MTSALVACLLYSATSIFVPTQTPDLSYPYPSPTPYPTYLYPTSTVYNPPSYFYPSPTPYPTYYTYPSPTYYPPTNYYQTTTPYPTYCQPPQNGCGDPTKYWDSNTCMCKSMQDTCYQTPGCTWTGTTCQCTQGLETELPPFPIPELGNCNDCTECSQYCANSSNRPSCLAYIQNRLGTTPPPAPVLTPLNSTTIKSTTPLTLSSLPQSEIDLYLQPLDSPTDLIFITRQDVNASGSANIDWNSTNHPNGRYRLIAKTVSGSESSLTASATEITLNNPNVTETTTNLILPSNFKPSEIPTDKNTTVSEIKTNYTENASPSLSLSGTAPANSIVTIIIYSQPIVVTVKADANGVWKYDLQKPLEPGSHVAYAAVTSSTGAKIRSEVANFIIQPVSAAEPETGSYIVASAPEVLPSQTNFLFLSLLLISAGLLLIGGLAWLKYS